MPHEDHKRKREDCGISEKDMKELISLIEKLGDGIELLYYLIENKRIHSFVAILLSAEGIELEDHIRSQKRSTDLLFEIDKEKDMYALLCQETEVDGGYYFTNRLAKTIKKKGGSNIYISEIEIKNTKHKLHEIIFRLLNMYRRAKANKSDGEISYYSLK